MKRRLVQIGAAIAGNGYISGFLGGTIYKGGAKNLCFPGLNCYSCPCAFLSCPVGALQIAFGDVRQRFPFYMLGLIISIGALGGRFACGWLCPFGLVQELLCKIPSPKLRPRFRYARYLKYAVLSVFVVLMPLIFVNSLTGVAPPYFCMLICPAGTLEGGLPLIAANESLQSLTGPLFFLKLSILGATVLASVFTFRPFCRLLCPLGAMWGLFNRASLYRLRCDKRACSSCGKCAEVCGMGVSPDVSPSSPECIRCGKCAKSCPTGALSIGNIPLPPSCAKGA